MPVNRLLDCGRLGKGEAMTYDAVHARLAVERGRAAGYPCSDCGGQAQAWAYDHTDPCELTQQRHGRIVAYSADLDLYRPLCWSCHVRLDGNGYERSQLQELNAERRRASSGAVVAWVREQGCLVAVAEISQAFPDINVNTLCQILSRAASRGHLQRAAWGKYSGVAEPGS